MTVDIDANLVSNLQDRYLEFSEEMKLVSHLFHVSEKEQKEILRTPQVIQVTTACMERVLREKRCRHYLELWKQTDPEAEPERYQSYCDAFYAENQRIQELDRQRLYSITDLLSG